MKVVYIPDPVHYQRMTTSEIRESFLIHDLFQPDEISMLYLDVDRAIVGSIVPVEKPLQLVTLKELATDYFAERREVGLLNVGGSGVVQVDGIEYKLKNKDVLYIGRGSKEIECRSEDRSNPAKLYLLSYPAHKAYPTGKVEKADAEPIQLGSLEESNKRTIFKMIHPGNIQSCQLVMGFTELHEGCVWNTMPPHTHERRMEIYFYFDMNDSAKVFHLMGKPDETRHIVVANSQAVVSPSWSIHSGVGTGAYTFCWGMGGENQDFADMDNVEMDTLK